MPVQPFFDPEVFGLPDSPGVTTQPERAAMFTFYGMQPLVGLVQVIPDMGTVLESDLTPFPREDGAAAVSHRVLRPIRLTMEVRLGLENDISQVRAVWARIKQLWQDGTIMEVVTLKDTYPNMAIKRVAEITRGEYWNGLSARVQLQEAQVVTVAAPTVPTRGLGEFSREALVTDSIQPSLPPEFFEAPNHIAMIAQERAEEDSRVRPPERVSLRVLAPRFGQEWGAKQDVEFTYSGARIRMELRFGALFSPQWTMNWEVNGIRQFTHRRVAVGTPLLDSTSPFQLLVVPRGELGVGAPLDENAFNETHQIILVNQAEVGRLGF